jgi:Excreted virulence factor EspC, type VII ESX diderm
VYGGGRRGGAGRHGGTEALAPRLEVDTPTLRSVASQFSDAATTIGDAGTTATSAAGPTDPDVDAGLGALTAAWGGVIEVVAEDVAFLSTQVGDAAAVYDQVDHNMAERTRRRGR